MAAHPPCSSPNLGRSAIPAQLQGGKAVLNFGKVAKAGNYKVKATYAGNTSFGGSKAKTTFRVT